jgi:hypothetical protein
MNIRSELSTIPCVNVEEGARVFRLSDSFLSIVKSPTCSSKDDFCHKTLVAMVL